MGKGGYTGGSTVVGPGSGWFTPGKPQKRRKLTPAAACGNALTTARREERANWDYAEDKALIVSRDELEAVAGKSSKEMNRRPVEKAASPPKKQKKKTFMTARARKRARLGLD